jgi:curved DNA-binding protein CbpA
MKLESAYFDKIRLGQAEPEEKPTRLRACDAPGCKDEGTHKAPKGRKAEGQYFWFCINHVRDYNKTYNYFSGMNDDAVAAFQKEAIVGHRPTWRMGVDAKSAESQPPGGRAKAGWSSRGRGPFDAFKREFEGRDAPPEPRRQVHNMERKSLKALGLDETATKEEVKARYKMLVKRHHPDANGGDRSLEDRLREIIQAYNYLKSIGTC